MKKHELMQAWKRLVSNVKSTTDLRAMAGDPTDDDAMRMVLDWTDHRLPSVLSDDHLKIRLELGKVFLHTRLNLSEKRRHAMSLIGEHLELVSGWSELVHRADACLERGDTPECAHHLDHPWVWWTNTTSETFEVRQLRADLLKDIPASEHDAKMPEAGFFKLEQGIYRQRVVADIVHELLNRDVARLGHLLRMVLAMTSSGDVARDPGRAAPWVVDDEVHSAQASILRRFVDAHRTVLLALPHQPLATLTAESNNMGMLAERAIDRGIKFHGAGDQLSILVFDRRLVLKEQSHAPDTFIRIPVSKADDLREDEPIDEISALLRSLQGLEAMSKRDRRQTLTDIPRVVAGMFLAATQDAVRSDKLGLNPGEFLECEGANRLTQLVGLQRRTRYTRRVAAVRDWLTQIKLHRQLVDFVDGRRVSIERSFPIVQRLDTQITLETELPSSLERVRTEIGVWRLEPTLWKMRTHDSGAAGFMLLDSRAFHISTESSEPFNLYWAIVQRAYNDARDGRVDEQGVYTPYARTLYEWAGMRLKSDARHFQRVRERMHDHLKLMVDHGLLCNWSCPELEHPDLFSKDAFKSAKIELTLPTSLAQYLPSPRAKTDSKALLSP